MIVPSPLDALLPPEMARRAEEVGAAKVAMDGGRLVALAVLAGAGIFSTVALAGAGEAPWGAPALSWSGFLVRNLLPVTLGNVIGGTLLVGGTYWFIDLRPRGERRGAMRD
ncbi:MAG TPA: hypothetical protein VMR23_09830 [Candidatus Limnocylindria bacterium]|nr:hypothetical protein [Candidatus Limnocylindria bacterium]